MKSPSSLSRPAVAAGLALALAAHPCPSRAADPGPGTVDGYTERVPTGFVNWGEGYAEVDVVAIYSTVRYGGSHAKIRAIEDAEKKSSDALYRLLRGMNISGAQRLAGEQPLEAALRQTIEKERSMDIRGIVNESMNTRFRLPLYGRKGLAEAIHTVQYNGQTQPGPLAGATASDYTSLVLDATHATVFAALFPRILNEAGEVLYGPGDLTADGTRGSPTARYLVPLAEGAKPAALDKDTAKLVGQKPLVVPVEKAGGEFYADVVVPAAAEATLRQANVGALLAQGRVFILLAKSIDVSGQ